MPATATLERAAAPFAALAPVAAPARVAVPAPAAAVLPSTLDLAAHRGAMLRFARRRIRDDALAEDAVQDALLAAMSARDSFQGTSALRTWLIGILSHKIQDAFRRETRYVKLGGAGGDTENGERFDALLAESAPEQDGPLAALIRARMHAALAEEVDRLPTSLKSVFLMQVVEGLETTEVCRRLNISEANCWVRLHRARKRLTERLSDHLVPA